MGRKPSDKSTEKRRIILRWLDIAANLDTGQTLCIPTKHDAECRTYKNLGTKIVTEFQSIYENSIYHNLKLRCTKKHGIFYLIIEKVPRQDSIAFIKDRYQKDKTLQLMLKAKHTRRAQITLLLVEGYTKEEIRFALGNTITPEEDKLLL